MKLWTVDTRRKDVTTFLFVHVGDISTFDPERNNVVDDGFFSNIVMIPCLKQFCLCARLI